MSVVGLRTPIETNSDLCPVVVVGMGGAPKPREGKISPDGRQTYSSQAILIVDRDGEGQPQKSASVHVVEPAATYALGERFMAQGKVWVQPYESNSRVALSITVERLVPIRQGGPAVEKRGGE